MYIIIEGIDTAGKSTQVNNVAHHFKDAIVTKEPGGTAVGAKIRELVLFHEIKSATAEALLFLADRAEHIESIIKPNLHKTIISDRSLISGIAYAYVAKKFSLETLVELNNFACDEVMPDLAFILKMSEEELSARLSQKKHDVIESRGINYLLEIQEALISAVKATKINYHIIDASKNIEEITNEIVTIIKANNE